MPSDSRRPPVRSAPTRASGHQHQGARGAGVDHQVDAVRADKVAPVLQAGGPRPRPPAPAASRRRSIPGRLGVARPMSLRPGTSTTVAARHRHQHRARPPHPPQQPAPTAAPGRRLLAAAAHPQRQRHMLAHPQPGCRRQVGQGSHGHGHVGPARGAQGRGLHRLAQLARRRLASTTRGTRPARRHGPRYRGASAAEPAGPALRVRGLVPVARVPRASRSCWRAPPPGAHGSFPCPSPRSQRCPDQAPAHDGPARRRAPRQLRALQETQKQGGRSRFQRFRGRRQGGQLCGAWADRQEALKPRRCAPASPGA